MPWLYGEASHPQRYFCKICYHTFRHGGFGDQHGTFKAFIEQSKTESNLITEFLDARKLLIQLITDGTIKLRLRGDQRTGSARRSRSAAARCWTW